ncbi:Pectate lyase superfamily protein [compost metagenome]
MKKIIQIIALLTTTIAFGQAPPELISFRAIALNSGGSPVTNTTIAIKFSILEGSASGTIIYEEVHHPTTDANGAYNLRIGEGTATTGTFSTIPWDSAAKYLKLSQDITNGTTFVVVGQPTQLVSVPYALYAKNALHVPENSMETVKTVYEDLRLYTDVAPDKVIYVKGYYKEADGGGGFFIYRENENMPDNGGIYIQPNTANAHQGGDSSIKGRWVRLYDGYINAMYFGIMKYPDVYTAPYNTISNSSRIQTAIDYIADSRNPNSSAPNVPAPPIYSQQRGALALYFPSGHYFIDQPIILKSEVHLIGEQGTLFEVAFGKNYPYMFEIPAGPTKRLCVENFQIDLGGERKENPTTAGGFHFGAKFEGTDTKFGGGLWGCSFKNIRITSANGHGIWLEGGEHSPGNNPGALDNQYLLFERVWIIRTSPNVNCLKITGAINTTTFLQCNFEIPYVYNTDTVPIPVELGTNILITADADYSPVNAAVVSFINCATGGHVVCGFKIVNAENITIDGCWIEDTEIAIDIQNSQGINVLNSRLVNAAGIGSLLGAALPQGQGKCISILNSHVNIERNFVQITEPDNVKLTEGELFIMAIGDNNVVNSRNNCFNDIRQSETFGITEHEEIKNIKAWNYLGTANEWKSGLELSAKKVVLVNKGTDKPIDRINSTINSGETIFIRAEESDIIFNAWNPVNELTGRNIYLGGPASVTLQQGHAATFMKLDGVNNKERCVYQLVSIY